MNSNFDMAEAQWLEAMQAALASVQAELSLPQLIALLAIANQPGISVNDLAERTSASQQTTSRYVSVLTGRYEALSGRGPGQPLIAQGVSDEDPRKRALYLTDAGAELVRRILPQNLKSQRMGADK